MALSVFLHVSLLGGSGGIPMPLRQPHLYYIIFTMSSDRPAETQGNNETRAGLKRKEERQQRKTMEHKGMERKQSESKYEELWRGRREEDRVLQWNPGTSHEKETIRKGNIKKRKH